MQLVVWNMQGRTTAAKADKWDALWTHYISPLLGSTEDVVGLTVEAGWAPWVADGNVRVNAVYGHDSAATWFDAEADAASAFCRGVSAKRQRVAYWVPWVKNLDGMRSNSRCSMGAVVVPATRRVSRGDRFLDPDPQLCLRPMFRFLLTKPTAGSGIPDLSVFLVHLVSGRTVKAQAQIGSLVRAMSKLIPQGSAAIVVGDFNIDLLQQANAFTLPAKWRVVNTGVATQQSGGELDYALLYDPNGTFQAATAKVLERYKSGNNPSDHSVMCFSVQLS